MLSAWVRHLNAVSRCYGDSQQAVGQGFPVNDFDIAASVVNFGGIADFFACANQYNGKSAVILDGIFDQSQIALLKNLQGQDATGKQNNV